MPIGNDQERPASSKGVSRGDQAAVSILALLALVPGIPYVPLRHGLLAAATLVVLADLASGRGVLARCLSAPWLDRAADASFGLFALQMPVGVWFAIATLRSSAGTKSATVETGYQIQVPLFLEQGTKVKVDTRDGSYLGRVND